MRFAKLAICVALLASLPAIVPGKTILLSEGDSLQAALDRALPGDIIELAAGATFTGNFVLPNKIGYEWIVIRSSAWSKLPSGVRVNPDQAQLMPKIVSPNYSPALSTATGAHHYHFIGIEITTAHNDTTSTYANLILLQDPLKQLSLSQVPTHIIFDRSYIHGSPAGNVRRGIALNSAHTTVIDSHLSDFHEVGADSQAIAGWNGPGPFAIVNNYLEGAGENIMFGGATPSIVDLVPSDIEIRHNHFAKPLSWKIGDPAYAGIPWTVKNLFELKNARRVSITDNIFERNWVHAQNGFAILFTVRSESGRVPWAVVEHVTFSRNIVRQTPGGINILGRDGPSQLSNHITISHNLFEDVGGSTGSDGRLFQLLSGTVNVVIENNTAFQTGNIIIADGAAHSGFVFRNNIAPHNRYGVSGSGAGVGMSSLNFYFPGAIFLHNVHPGGNPRSYPPDNYFPPTLGDVGFVNLAEGDYRLAPTSPYRNLGADITALQAATAGVISGIINTPTSPGDR